ncbi:2-succinyl-5-enolpyruvyl-6-hydroxy-3-cyclohexene-1-carboxylic-acid synthase [Pontibacter qinzhouensis]|uniref:2-succinyl-5-enolpyruvyl-6-hydroxy-3-cyclohexene-1-carboxylate synthase n=1 Tax=Pontibacter qinzhouensis TaxID=2603253 RepID=A0A5C8ILR2_9BACT|nr:2-succinyl-5-enolpyruvyl-6-hydroxy-3-cyclohexene-1-carboxylic-acid synthase [Pontibacter qinzhouensis]TXK22024.1 2-succinyl-5-enolpyruvyl-6-hydroxy-3-cyclohexene-1-carboxylic-acid synthase [Pontibacter qinzhouensis]
MILQPVVNIAEICARKGVQQVVLSPGSRCAPLTIAFARHPDLTVRTVSDERAAAFIALGMALTTGKATVLVCTSGTAALNYAPAIAEAYFQQVPLLVLTADRPPEWIDQMDGQTIRQQQVFGQHVKNSFTFPVDLSHPDAVWHTERLVSEALNEAAAFPAGPVHVNVPLREPFYPAPGEELQFDANVKVIEEQQNTYSITDSQANQWLQEVRQYKRVLIVVGQDAYQEELLQQLGSFMHATGAVVVGDSIANVHQLPQAVRYHDAILACPEEEKMMALQPELLLTFGKSIISKSLKLYLRQYKPKAHWHIQAAGAVADTFQVLTRIIRSAPTAFFEGLSEAAGATTLHVSAYQTCWAAKEEQAAAFLRNYTAEAEYSELAVLAQVLHQLPQPGNLHLANSMAVRYANILGLKKEQKLFVYANRGTSGIDGSTSTSVGCALTSPYLTTLITGDLAFFYDRNGLWHNYLPQNLRIILLNNHAGGIFRLIDGPRQQPELEPFFETHQALNGENTARDFNLAYTACHSLEELQVALKTFFTEEAGAGILEIFTDSKQNQASFARYKQQLLKSGI